MLVLEKGYEDISEMVLDIYKKHDAIMKNVISIIDPNS